ncbi:hypothetical protein HYPSUDRAFT_32857 [Hypholoma sublateritium FD-334 SS-4]|uniref:Uncharacterized protein n=1 Tax=Hypholoma sublateritium (strain FD-334 SS-4) TaxID=945553 RepID=A0A0D2QCP7_HYPSF|nr:hypothetical protein HYPSUDRAFT_32857 [Hypholoma sublateritium FD-334 SS-4]
MPSRRRQKKSHQLESLANPDRNGPTLAGKVKSTKGKARLTYYGRLPDLETFGVIFHKFPQLQLLILRGEIPGMMLYDNTKTGSSSALDRIGDVELDRLYPSINLRALAISLPHLEFCHLYLSKIMKNLEYVEIVNPRNGYLVSRVAENEHAATLCQWQGLRNLKKFRLSLAQNFVWDEATLFSSLPEGVDLEIDRPPLASKTALINILSSTKFRTITVILADKSRRCDFIVCKTFSEDVCSIKPNLGCPTTLILPENETLDSQVIDILGAYFTIRDPQESAAAYGLIGTSEMRDFEYYGCFEERFEEDDYNHDPNWENYWSYQPNGPRIYDSD